MSSNSLSRSRRAGFAAPGLALSAFAVVLTLLVSCSPRFKPEGGSLLSFTEAGGGGIVLNLGRDAESVVGSWEDPSLAHFGLVEGVAKADGSLSLRFYGAVTALPVGSFAGSYRGGETGIEGKLAFGKAEPRPLSLALSPGPTAKLELRTVHRNTREGLPSTETDPTRYIYQGFEPSSPPAFRDFYRGTFQGGKALKDIIEKEGEEFLADFKGTTAQLKEQSREAQVRAWYYEGRQLLSYRSKGLMVMALRRGIYTGGESLSQALRFAVLDEERAALLGPGDFLVEGSEAKLPALIAASVREELGLEEGKSLASEGFVSDEAPSGGDFFVYSRGLGFHYAPGVFAPKETGELFVLLPFERLAGLLKPETMSRFGLAAVSGGAGGGGK
jgi:hypothetical protein